MTDWGRRRSIFRGILRLAQFDSQGLLEFGDTPQAFLNSLAPLLAFPLVGGARTLLAGSPRQAAVNMLGSLIALLAPPVLSHLFAMLWHREKLWLRYIVAFNWCEVALFVPLLILWLIAAGRPGAYGLVWTVPAIYWAILNGFLAKRGLRISLLRAIILVIAVYIGFYVLMVLPTALLASLHYVTRGV